LGADGAKDGIFIRPSMILDERLEPTRFPTTRWRFHPAPIQAVITDSRDGGKIDSHDP
jgi:hypothetical protein